MSEPASKQLVAHQAQKNHGNINGTNNAFNLRHAKHDFGQIGVQATGFVTESQMRQKWIQPKTVST